MSSVLPTLRRLFSLRFIWGAVFRVLSLKIQTWYLYHGESVTRSTLTWPHTNLYNLYRGTPAFQMRFYWMAYSERTGKGIEEQGDIVFVGDPRGVYIA